MMQRIISITSLLIAFCVSAGAQQMSLFDKLLYMNQGDTLPYRLMKPVSPESMEAFPLVIFLHGAGERGNDNEMHIKHISELFTDPKNRGKYPCYVLAPQCPKNQKWAQFEGPKDRLSIAEKPSVTMKMVLELIDKISEEFPIDQTRIYITGLSMGGYGTWDLLARFPDKFAAAVPICGGGAPQTVSKFKHVPIWAFHGALDKIVLPQESRTMIDALRRAGATPGYTEYPDIGHDSWVQAYKEPHLIHWLFKQKLQTAVSKKTN